jgi:hypothetical protein
MLIRVLLAALAVLLEPGRAADGNPIAEKESGLAPSTSAVTRVQGFSLTDQYERTHHLAFPSPKPTLLTIADRKGSAQVSAWVQPVSEWFGERVSIVGVADVSKVPGMLRGRVRKAFREQISHPVLLDWQGIHCRTLNSEGDRVTVLLLSPQGEIRLRLSGPATPSGLDRVKQAIESVLRSTHADALSGNQSSPPTQADQASTKEVAPALPQPEPAHAVPAGPTPAKPRAE